MRTFYVIPDKRAIADVQPVIDDVWMITRINVPSVYRGTGVGSTLLRMILEDADAERVTLSLGIVDSGGLSFDDLGAWYRRHGFVDLQGYPGRMERLPR